MRVTKAEITEVRAITFYLHYKLQTILSVMMPSNSKFIMPYGLYQT